MELPSARVVRQAGLQVAPPRVPLMPKVKAGLRRASQPFIQFFGLAIALWPLTAVLLLGIVAIWSIGAHGSVRP